jgi:hypothetical protein
MAFCPRCAAPNIDTAAACAACGAPLSAAPAAPGAPPPMNQQFAGANAMAVRTNGLAIAGFICAFLCALPGLIMSIIAYNQCKSSGGQLKGEGLALAGIIISGVMILISIIVNVAVRS